MLVVTVSKVESVASPKDTVPRTVNGDIDVSNPLISNARLKVFFDPDHTDEIVGVKWGLSSVLYACPPMNQIICGS